MVPCSPTAPGPWPATSTSAAPSNILLRLFATEASRSDLENRLDHAMAKFSGYRQLGDTYSIQRQLKQSSSLGELDPKAAEICRTWRTRSMCTHGRT
ncbi:hypothetical protein ACFX13_043907 [Malus domestica]